MLPIKRIRKPVKALICLLSLVWIVVESGCSAGNNEKQERELTELESKLNDVLQRMISQCEDPKDKETLNAAQLFQNLEGLSMDVVGFSVPLNSGSRRAHISFTLDYFQSTLPDVLATEGLEDLHMAKEEASKSDSSK